MPKPESPFTNPGEEIQWLEKQLETKKRELKETGKETKPEEAAKEVIREYTGQAPVVTPSLLSEDAEETVSSLENEPHAKQVEELLAISKKQGILNAVNVARHLNNPHLLDDFHDRLALELSRSIK
ncbi:hypothetical protein IIA95_03235 [Patescibacteria group bacterium]|nr:hypothetical protein [Patescibacteria group bacterium]